MRPLPTIAVLVALFAFACAGDDALAPPRASTTTSPAAPADTATAPPRPTSESLPAIPSEPLSERDLSDMLERLLRPDPEERSFVLTVAAATADPRFVAPLIDAFVLTPPGDREDLGATLRALTGEPFGDAGAASFEWVEWLGNQEDWPLHDDYIGWKGRYLEDRIRSNLTRFLVTGVSSQIRADLIQWGGVAIDGIPALDQPFLAEAAQDRAYLSDSEAVLGIAINGEARAYPLRILDWHEMVNDVVGGAPISIAYCTLCGSAVLYDSSIDGEVLTFGTSGLLFESNKLMYDRATDTLWNQLTGRPVLGPLAGSDLELGRLPIVRTTWGEWLERHPDTGVLSIETGFTRDYRPGAAYGAYFASADLWYPVSRRSELLEAKAEVFALLIDGVPRAYPLAALAEHAVVNDELAARPVVLVVDPGSLAVRAYEGTGAEFLAELPALEGKPAVLRDDSGQRWTVDEDALIAADGRVLPRLGGHLAYWFGWFSFFPHTSVYGLDVTD